MKTEKEVEDTILQLLDKYYHYKFMISKSFSFNGNKEMNLYDFYHWLKSKD